MMTFATVSINIPRRELLYRAWVPYNYSRPIAYWVSALGQLLAMYILAGVNVGFVLLFGGILFRICSLINIFKLRFKKQFTFTNQPSSAHQSGDCQKIEFEDFVTTHCFIKR